MPLLIVPLLILILLALWLLLLPLSLWQRYRLGKARRVDRNQHIGRAVAALVLEALQQFFLFAFDAVDLDAGFLGKTAIKRFVGLVVTSRVDVQGFFFGLDVAEKNGKRRKRQKSARD